MGMESGTKTGDVPAIWDGGGGGDGEGVSFGERKGYKQKAREGRKKRRTLSRRDKGQEKEAIKETAKGRDRRSRD
jgi:hypothetical protein